MTTYRCPTCNWSGDNPQDAAHAHVGGVPVFNGYQPSADLSRISVERNPE